MGICLSIDAAAAWAADDDGRNVLDDRPAARDDAAKKTDAEIQTLINQLGDPEPEVRNNAAKALRERGAVVKRALLKATESPRPAIADAAQALLAEIPWSEPGDSAAIKTALSNYGSLEPAERAVRLRALATTSTRPGGLAGQRKATLRVLSQEHAPEVAWLVLPFINPDASWAEPIKQIDEATASSALLLFKARHLQQVGQQEQALALMQRTIDLESREPTTSVQNVYPATAKLTQNDRRQRRYAKAAERLRTLLQRGDDSSAPAINEMEESLLELQTRFGPLPGFAGDLTRDTSPTGGVRQAVALAAICERVGTGIGPLLLDAALADRPNEDNVAKATRLVEAGNMLAKLGAAEKAIPVLERVSAMAGDDLATNELAVRAGEADLRLHDLYAQTERYLKAATHLELAIARLQMQFEAVRANGERTAIPMAELQARIHWNYFKHAEQQKDTAAMQDRAKQILATGSDSSSIFLDVLPTLEQTNTPAEVDEYFNRVYAAADAQLKAQPDDASNYNEVAWLCARAGRRLDEALKLSTEAVKRKPDEAAFLDTLAEAQFRVGKIKDAIASEEKALQSRPDDTFMQEQLARFKQAATTRPSN